MADDSGEPRHENMKARRMRIDMVTNTFTAPVLLTENDNPGASLERRRPAELKKADFLFWLQCRGDSCKGLNLKAQFVRRYVCSQNLKCSVLLFGVKYGS